MTQDELKVKAYDLQMKMNKIRVNAEKEFKELNEELTKVVKQIEDMNAKIVKP